MFDTFVTERSNRQRKGLRYTMSFSAFLHVVAGVALVGWSFWRIEKLMPRYVPVTFREDFKPPPAQPEPPKLPPVQDVGTTPSSGPSHPRDITNIPTARPRPGGDKTIDSTPPGVEGGNPNAIGLVPSLPPPEALPPPLPPPKPPGLSEAERHALILAYLHDTVQPTVLRHFEYPSDAQRNGVEGTVIVRLTIDAAGRLESSKVVSCPDPILCAAALISADHAAPFPRPPAELGTVTVDVRFEYRLD